MNQHCPGVDADTEAKVSALASIRRRDWTRHRRLFPASDGVEFCREMLAGEGISSDVDAVRCLRIHFVRLDRVISPEDDAKLSRIALELHEEQTLTAGAKGYFAELEARVSERFDDGYLTATRLHELVGALSDYFVFGQRT